MFVTVIVLIVLVAVVLVLVVLAQNSKGGGLSSQFGGSGTSQLIGVKKTGDLLERLTWILAFTLIALTMSTKFLIGDMNAGEFTSPNIENAQENAPAIPSLENQDAPESTEEEESAE